MSNNSMRHTAIALLLALSLPAAALATGQVGEPAADFTLNAVQGGSYTFSDYDGQVRFLFFFGHG
ncbi:hypothetical protein H8E07_09800 [bacterium]|nr:hypothetical protein [bacterium]